MTDHIAEYRNVTTMQDSYTVPAAQAKALRLANSLRGIEALDAWLPKLADLLADDSEAVTTIGLIEDLTDSLRRRVLHLEAQRVHTTCTYRGCHQPRYETEHVTYFYCKAHMVDHWARDKERRRHGR